MTQRTLSSPRDVINIAKGMDDHGHRVSTLIADVTDLVHNHLPHVFRMCEQMQDQYECIDAQIGQDDDKDTHL